MHLLTHQLNLRWDIARAYRMDGHPPYQVALAEPTTSTKQPARAPMTVSPVQLRAVSIFRIVCISMMCHVDTDFVSGCLDLLSQQHPLISFDDCMQIRGM